jgi:hypothetical protein
VTAEKGREGERKEGREGEENEDAREKKKGEERRKGERKGGGERTEGEVKEHKKERGRMRTIFQVSTGRSASSNDQSNGRRDRLVRLAQS